MVDFDFFPKAPEVVKEPLKGYRPPVTSIKANESVKDSKEAMYVLIAEALEKMKIGGTSEEIANFMGIKHERVWKRLSEMEERGTIYNVGTTRKNSSGRMAMVRQLTSFKTNQ